MTYAYRCQNCGLLEDSKGSVRSVLYCDECGVETEQTIDTPVGWITVTTEDPEEAWKTDSDTPSEHYCSRACMLKAMKRG